MVQEDIVVNFVSFNSETVAADIRKLKTAIGLLNKSFDSGATSSKAYTNAFNQLNDNLNILSSGLTRQQSIREAVAKSTEKWSKIEQDLANSINKSYNALVKQEQKMKQTEQTSKKLTNIFQKLSGNILGFALSTMFMGMVISRLFQNIAKISVDSFMKISAGATPASQTIVGMGAAFEFLKFSIGEAIGTALMPFLETLIEIVDGISAWVEENPELTAGLIGLGAAIGIIMMVGGQLLLFFNSLLGLIISLSPYLATAFAGLGPALAAAAVLIAVFIALWITDFNGFRDTVTNIWDLLVQHIGEIWDGLTTIIGGVLDIITGLLTDDTEKMWKGVEKIVAGAVTILSSLLKYPALIFVEALVWGVTAAIRVLGTLVQFSSQLAATLARILVYPFDLVIDRINGIINSLREFGIFLPRIARAGDMFSDAMRGSGAIANQFLQGSADWITKTKNEALKDFNVTFTGPVYATTPEEAEKSGKAFADSFVSEYMRYGNLGN